MQYTTIGHSRLRVSRVAFGCMSTVANPTYQGVAEAQGIAAIRCAVDAGINFFDTAPGYGDGASEALLGRAVKDIRDDVVIADKINTATLSAEDVTNECEKSLKRLQTDRIDLYQIHWPKNVVPIDETLRAMEQLVEDGKVRELGVCNFGPIDLGNAISTGVKLATNQIAYSLLSRAVEYEVSGQCEEAGLKLLCYSPVAQGLLADKFRSADDVPESRARTRIFSGERREARHGEAGCEPEAFEAVSAVREIAEGLGHPMADVALAWLLHQTAVGCVLAGASTEEQVKQNAAAADIHLSPEVLDDLDAATATVKSRLGTSLDMWASPSRIR